MKYTGERVVPWNRGVGVTVAYHHLMRYAWATQYTFNKSIIDLGCGTGYGSYILSFFAKFVIGIDINNEAIEMAKARFNSDNLVFKQGRVEEVSPRENFTFVCFEVLEHLEEIPPIVKKLFPMVWSIPVKDCSAFHKRAYSIKEIDFVMGKAQYVQGPDGLIRPRDESDNLNIRPVYLLGITSENRRAV